MAGFSSISGQETIVSADNASFDGTDRGGALTTDGQLFIGSTASPHVKKGSLTSPLGTVTIGYSSPNITLDLAGGAVAIEKIAVDASTAPGTNPVVPTSGTITITGAQVAASTIGANVIRTDSLAANALTIEVQRSTAVAATDSTKNGVSHFDNARFTVDSSGFVSTSGTGIGETITGQSGGALSPTAGNWNISGATVVAGTAPLVTAGSGSTLTINAQRSQAIAAADSTKIGLANFDSARFTVDADGFVSTSGTGIGETITGQSGGALAPTAGNWNISGASTAAGTSPVVTSGSGSTLTLNVQKSQAIASTDATKIGLSAFDSARFSVDANGFVTLAGTGVGETITGDTGGALAPTGGNWNILGGPGVTTSGSGSTLTINSVVFTDRALSATVTSDSGSFCTAAGVTLTTPASPAQGELLQFSCTTADTLIVKAGGTHLIRIGSLVSSAGGTATSTSIGDSLTLRYYAASTTWIATGVIGTWVMA